MATADVEILGAGIFGLSIAWECRRRGATVRLVDPFGPGAGASGGVVGALAPHTPDNWNDKKAFQLQALRMHPPFWEDVAAAGGTDPGYARIGRVQPVAGDRALGLAQRRAQDAAANWGGADRWQVVEAATLPGWGIDLPAGHYIHDTLSARIDPARACAALVAALEAHGVTVRSSTGAAHCRVLATGHAGLAALSAELGRPVGNGVKGQAAVLQADMRDAPQAYVDGIHFVPQARVRLAIGSTSERDWTDTAPDDQLDRLIDRARALCPVIADAPVVARWAGIRPRASTRAPLLGRHPLHRDTYIANGGFKIGVGIAPLVGRVMADLVLDGNDAIPAAFRPDALP